MRDAILVLLLLLAGSADAFAYKWVDDVLVNTSYDELDEVRKYTIMVPDTETMREAKKDLVSAGDHVFLTFTCKNGKWEDNINLFVMSPRLTIAFFNLTGKNGGGMKVKFDEDKPALLLFTEVGQAPGIGLHKFSVEDSAWLRKQLREKSKAIARLYAPEGNAVWTGKFSLRGFMQAESLSGCR